VLNQPTRACALVNDKAPTSKMHMRTKRLKGYRRNEKNSEKLREMHQSGFVFVTLSMKASILLDHLDCTF
jgi:hypothetical protein